MLALSQGKGAAITLARRDRQEGYRHLSAGKTDDHDFRFGPALLAVC